MSYAWVGAPTVFNGTSPNGGDSSMCYLLPLWPLCGLFTTNEIPQQPRTSINGISLATVLSS
jgi:hypothetical protein